MTTANSIASPHLKLEKHYLNTVPDFDGNVNEIVYFLRTADA